MFICLLETDIGQEIQIANKKKDIDTLRNDGYNVIKTYEVILNEDDKELLDMYMTLQMRMDSVFIEELMMHAYKLGKSGV